GRDPERRAVRASHHRTWIAERRGPRRALERDARARPGAAGDPIINRGPGRRCELARPENLDHRQLTLTESEQHIAFALRASEHQREIAEQRCKARIEHQAGVDRSERARPLRAVADVDAPPLHAREEACPRPVPERARRSMDLDLGERGTLRTM